MLVMENSLIQVEFKIFGRVQYVMFRDFAKRKADKYGIKGYVKNNEDGTVTVVAEGLADMISKYEKKLWQGPILSKVVDIKKISKGSINNFSDFQIKYE